MASVTGRTFVDRGHAGHGLQGGTSGGARRRVSLHTQLLTITPCESNTLGYPKAALVAFCLAWLAYNAVSLIKAALRRAHGLQKVHEEVSSHDLALDISRTYDGMMLAIPAPHGALCRALSAKECANVLRELMSSVNRSRYQKHPRGPKKKPPERTAYRTESTSRLPSFWRKDDHIERAGILPELESLMGATRQRRAVPLWRRQSCRQTQHQKSYNS